MPEHDFSDLGLLSDLDPASILALEGEQHLSLALDGEQPNSSELQLLDRIDKSIDAMMPAYHPNPSKISDSFEDDSQKQPKMRRYNSWTLHRAEVFARTPRLPGETAAERRSRATEAAQQEWSTVMDLVV